MLTFKALSKFQGSPGSKCLRGFLFFFFFLWAKRFLIPTKIVLIPTRIVLISTNIRGRIAEGSIYRRRGSSFALTMGLLPWLSSEYHLVIGIATFTVKQPSLYETSRMKWHPVIPQQWICQQYYMYSLSKWKGFLRSWPWTRPPNLLEEAMALVVMFLPDRQVSPPCFSHTSRSTLCNTTLMLCNTTDINNLLVISVSISMRFLG